MAKQKFTTRIMPKTAEKLKRLANAKGISMGSMIDMLVERARESK